MWSFTKAYRVQAATLRTAGKSVVEWDIMSKILTKKTDPHKRILMIRRGHDKKIVRRNTPSEEAV